MKSLVVMENETQCRLCGRFSPLVKAHILPRSFYTPIMHYGTHDSPSIKDVPIIARFDDCLAKPKQVQSGIWDKKILCRECDGDLFGPLDSYAARLLLSSENWICRQRDREGNPVLYSTRRYDYKRLKLFYMSLLWRAAATAHQFYADVKIGPWEILLRQSLLANNPGCMHSFSVTPFAYGGEYGTIITPPNRCRIKGVNYIRFRYPTGGFVIKVDRRASPALLGRLWKTKPIRVKMAV
jgi:hypothetical protein